MKHQYILIGIILFLINTIQAQNSRTILDGNSVAAILHSQGTFFHDLANYRQGYSIPENGSVYSPGLIYFSELWFGGLDENNTIRLANSTDNFLKIGMFSGPYSTTTSYWTPEYLSNYGNSIWTVSREEIIYHIDNYAQPGYEIPKNIATWPGNGVLGLGVASDLAPFVDVDGDNIYNPNAGDYPAIKGDKATFAIMNESASSSIEAESVRMGLEFHLLFYQFKSSNYIDSTTFLNIKVINRGTHSYSNFTTSFYWDPDIGCSENDYFGSDSIRNMMYAYNATPIDPNCSGSIGFGNNPPAIGVVSLTRKMEISIGLGRVGYPCYYPLSYMSPTKYHDFWQLMNGLRPDGTPLIHGLCNTDTMLTMSFSKKYMFNGNPYTEVGWTEKSVGNPGGDRRGYMTLEPTSLVSGQEAEYDFAIIMNREGNHLENVQGLLNYADSVKEFFDSTFLTYDYTISGTGSVDNFENPEFPYDNYFEITRLDGKGNMGIALDLTEESVQQILDSNFISDPSYKKGHGPIDIHVVDPGNHALGYFQLKFHAVNNSTTSIDSASWTIYRYDEKGGLLIDSVNSVNTINSGDEQFIPDWGMMVTINQENYFVPEGLYPNYVNYVTTPIEATLDFENPTKKWLTGVKDIDGPIAQNWILSGIDNYEDDSLSCYNDVDYRDQKENFENLLDGSITHFSLLRNCGELAPIHGNSNFFIQSSQTQSRIASSNSVDIVFTSDKSKWTRAVVVELCPDATQTQGGGEAGLPRSHYSVDKNGLTVGDTNFNPAEGQLVSLYGMGWFPGYAIDVEKGHRLNIAFGENSCMPEENGSDMLWNPTSTLYDSNGKPKFGGQHVLFILNNEDSLFSASMYDSCLQFHTGITSNNTVQIRNTWKNVMWTMYPLLADGMDLMETDAKIRIRVVKAYENFSLSGTNHGNPMFEWNLPVLLNESPLLDGVTEMLFVYPNPSSSTINIQWNEEIDGSTLRVISSEGFVVYETDVKVDESMVQLDLEHLSSGMYFVSMGSQNCKIVIQK